MQAVQNAITLRISTGHIDLITQYGVEALMTAIEDVTRFVGEVEEIGTSDVRGWVRYVRKALEQSNDMRVLQILRTA